MSFGKKLWENTGNLVRVGGALGVTVSAIEWYHGVRDHVLYEVIGDIGRDLTASIDDMFAIYGAGEVLNTVRQYREVGDDPNFLEHTGRIARLAPIAAPFLSSATDGDFFTGILLPAGICIAGHGLEYAGNLFRSDEESE
ncbi:MAG: hypothetical protein ABIJ92_02920 [Candidatus Aenigmatarchaeota archaeon]